MSLETKTTKIYLVHFVIFKINNNAKMFKQGITRGGLSVKVKIIIFFNLYIENLLNR